MAYGGVGLAGIFLLPQPRLRGYGGRGWQEHVEVDEGYAPVVLLDDSIIISFFCSPRLSSFQTLAERASFKRGFIGVVG